ncbi:MAG: DUF493 family protein [Crocinitomicaceae bacterium]|nr:DUF493 family protein [Crocinitomicaceae bacterium]MDG1777488.1 DUF493 family protein [Crocinitomicaceae bacterium]
MSSKFDSLKVQLELQEWPMIYLFKFIMPNDSELIAKVTALFDDGADLKYTNSKTGKFVSLSVKEMMLSADSVIEKYNKASKFKGVISL